jgi:hypothetical protein
MPKTNPKTIDSLEQKIAVERKQLQAAYDVSGCTNSIVLAYSIKLDKLINRYHKLTKG